MRLQTSVVGVADIAAQTLQVTTAGIDMGLSSAPSLLTKRKERRQKRSIIVSALAEEQEEELARQRDADASFEEYCSDYCGYY